MQKQYFAYTRVSTVKQGEGVSLDAQKEAIERYADQHGLNITLWFQEKETAAKQGRPVFTDMIKRLHQKQADGVVMHKIDRSARNLRDWATVGDLQDAGIDVHFAAESVDFASRGGRLTADIQAVIAADYIRNLREETIKGINGRLKQGLYPFKAPIGYLDNGGGEVKTICSKKGPLVIKAFELYASGEYSIRTLQTELKRRGLVSHYGSPLTTTGIEKLLRNPFYTGVIKIRRTGKSYPAIHEPLFSVDLFQAVQDVRTGRHRKKKVIKHNFTFRGVFSCQSCDRAMIPERQKGHVYYRCHVRKCGSNSIRETALQEQLYPRLQNLGVDHFVVQDFIAALRTRCKQLGKAASDNVHHMRSVRIDKQLENLVDAITRGVVGDDDFQKKKTELLLEKTKITQSQAKNENLGQKVDNLERFLELVKSLYSTYEIATNDEKRQLVKLAFSNRMVFDKKLYISTRNWVSQCNNMVHANFGTHHTDLGRSGLELQIDEIFEQLEWLECPKLQALLSLMTTIEAQNRQEKLPETTSPDIYPQAA